MPGQRLKRLRDAHGHKAKRSNAIELSNEKSLVNEMADAFLLEIVEMCELLKTGVRKMPARNTSLSLNTNKQKQKRCYIGRAQKDSCILLDLSTTGHASWLALPFSLLRSRSRIDV